ncbi:cytochrome-c peroxidase [Celeribacter arenosi]|uniref:Cytochrome c domain-containing protein n=1 Tax=Celeribacter arenosi TaxID=792649 RepID=A0ABP7KG95_9RHOB
MRANNRPAAALAIAALTMATLHTGALAAEPLPAPLTDADYMAVDPAEAALGQLLFYDPVLSGNDNIACSTCHHPRLGTSDGLPLGLGEGGIGLGPDRVVDPENIPEDRVPRNAPALYNLGALEYRSMFHDGRVETRADGTLRVPIEDPFFSRVSGILATQSAFPVLSADEMAGQVSENDLSKTVRKGRFSGADGAWELIAADIAAIPEYREKFAATYPEIAAGAPITFVEISNAIAAFMAFEFRADNSAFDRALRGQSPLDPLAQTGAELFYGDAGCSACHTGALQTDHGFHAMGQPQFGPGKTLPFEAGTRDEGRFLVTGKTSDLYAFRTPSLRNVTLTAPYGHTGAYADLRAFVVAHLAPRAAFKSWTPDMVTLPDLEVSDWETWENPRTRAEIAAAIKVPDRTLPDDQIDALMAFLSALEDDPARLGIPEAVPSGLLFEK